MTTADRELHELTDRLGLRYLPQDWGICNADAGRVGEFIRVCRTEELTPPQQYAMGELVLASMNEALVDGTADADLAGALKEFVALDLHGLDQHVRYWSSLADPDEFPLAGLLGRQTVTPGSARP